jgi:hypothetical protein
MLYLTEGVSFAGTCTIGKESAAFSLTKKALWSRIKNSGEWLRWLCEGIYRERGLVEEKPVWLEGKNVLLIDAREVRNLKGQRSLWRETRTAKTLVTLLLLLSLFSPALPDVLRGISMIPAARADTKRKRIMQLRQFSSA